MNEWRRRRVGVTVLLTAVTLRLLAIAVTTVTSLNPYAKADADQFARSAATAAATLASGHLPSLPANPNNVIRLWGIVLSPLWLLPGPNRVYGRLFVALCGAVAVYLLYRLGWTLHSPQAGVVAAVPMAIYPSVVLVHSTVLRESFVLLGIVGAAYLLLADSTELSWLGGARYPLGLLALALASVVRWENLPLYALGFGTGLVVCYRRQLPPWRLTASLATVGTFVGAWLGRPLIRKGLAFLVTKRDRRSKGRTVYLPEFRPDTVPKAVAFAPVGAIYFLFTPFPWMIETLADAVVFFEALGNLAAVGLAVLALPVAWRRSKPATAALVVAFTVGVALYGLVNANVGTNVRQRQMFLWVLFLFAGIAVAERTEGMLSEWVG